MEKQQEEGSSCHLTGTCSASKMRKLTGRKFSGLSCLTPHVMPTHSPKQASVSPPLTKGLELQPRRCLSQEPSCPPGVPLCCCCPHTLPWCSLAHLGWAAFFQTMGRTPWWGQGGGAHVKVDSRLTDRPSPTLGGRCWVPGRDLPGEMGGKRNKTPSALPSRSCSQRAQESGLVCMCMCWTLTTVNKHEWVHYWQGSEGQAFLPERSGDTAARELTGGPVVFPHVYGPSAGPHLWLAGIRRSAVSWHQSPRLSSGQTR